MEPVKALSSVPATGSAEPAAGTCMAAARSASAASQRRSTQSRPPRDPSPPRRPRAHALVTGLVPAAALSSTLPRPSHHPIPPTTPTTPYTTYHHLPPPITTSRHLSPPTTTYHQPTTRFLPTYHTYHHLPHPSTTSHTSHHLPQAACFRCQTPKPMGAGQYGGWMPGQPAGYGFDRRSDQRRNQARPSFESPGRAPRNTNPWPWH